MSWLGSLAAKTETLLNKVDQAAGQALQTSEKNSQYEKSNLPQASFLSTQPFHEDSRPLPQNQTYNVLDVKQNTSMSKLSKVDSKKDLDLELIEYLNDNQTPGSSSSQPAPATSASTERKSNENNKSDAVLKALPMMNTPTNNMDSSILRENQLLKDEIQSLNRELQSIASRGKSTQEEYNKAASRLEAERRQLTKREATIRELRERESDLMNALQAKDAQLSVLRVRLDEADAAVKEKEKKIRQFQEEKDRLWSILEDHSVSTGAQSQALDSLQERLKALEEVLKSERDKNHKLEADTRALMASSEQHKDHSASELVALQKKLSNEKARAAELSSQLKLSRSQVDMSRQELNQYKEKATRILQSKEKLISKLKETSLSGAVGADGSGASEPVIHSTELESLRSERDMLREELSSVQLSLETAKAEYADLEMHSEQEAAEGREQVMILEDALRSERRRRDELEAEVASKTQELTYAHEEVLAQRKQLQGRLAEREAEIQKLRNQLTTRTLNASSNEELEGRLHALTENLIQKQTHLEALSSERNSLSLQLERMEKHFKEAEMVAVRHSSSTISMNNDDDDVRARYNNLMHESPFDGSVARNVKKAANSIDRFGMRLGLFLRRYPIVRVFIIIYMFLLHAWVMVVLLTYKPEVHASDFAFPQAPSP